MLADAILSSIRTFPQMSPRKSKAVPQTDDYSWEYITSSKGPEYIERDSPKIELINVSKSCLFELLACGSLGGRGREGRNQIEYSRVLRINKASEQ